MDVAIGRHHVMVVRNRHVCTKIKRCGSEAVQCPIVSYSTVRTESKRDRETGVVSQSWCHLLVWRPATSESGTCFPPTPIGRTRGYSAALKACADPNAPHVAWMEPSYAVGYIGVERMAAVPPRSSLLPVARKVHDTRCIVTAVGEVGSCPSHGCTASAPSSPP
eukprot:scaffold40707_cov53-Phaeocystis_antarctica.AAC.2